MAVATDRQSDDIEPIRRRGIQQHGRFRVVDPVRQPAAMPKDLVEDDRPEAVMIAL